MGIAAEDLARLIGLAHVALDDPAVGLAHLGNRLARAEVHDLVEFQRFVRLAPAEDWNVQHDVWQLLLSDDRSMVSTPRRQYTPTVVCAATPRYGRTPLMPSHG